LTCEQDQRLIWNDQRRQQLGVIADIGMPVLRLEFMVNYTIC
jgi:hypothetical protein